MSDRDVILNELFGEEDKKLYDKIAKSKDKSDISVDDILKEFSNKPAKADKTQIAPQITKVQAAVKAEVKDEAKTAKSDFDACNINIADKQADATVTPELIKNTAVKQIEKQVIKKEVEIDQSVFGEETEIYVDNNSHIKTQDIKIHTDKAPTGMIEKFKTALIDMEEEEDDGEEPAFVDCEEQEEENIEQLESEMDSKAFSYIFKTVAAAIVGLVLLYLELAKNYSLWIPAALNPSGDGVFGYGFATLALTFILFVISIGNVFDGIASLFKKRFSSDCLIALGFIMVITFNALGTFGVINFSPAHSGSWQLYNSVIAFCACANFIGKYLFVKNVRRNLQIVDNDSVVSLYKSGEDELGNGEIGSVRKVDGVKNTFDKCFPEDICEQSNMFVVPVIILLAIAGFIVTVALSKGAVLGFMNAIAVLLMGVALTSELAYSLPIFLSSNKSRKNGGTFLGYDSVDEFMDMNTIVLKDTDLFESKDVFISGMKIFDKSKIKDTVVFGVSMFSAQNGPLKTAFEKIIDNKTEMIKEVFDYKMQPQMGFSGFIEGKQYFAGTRAYIMSQGVSFPKESYQTTFTKDERHVIYFADSENLLAVFVVNYGNDDQVAKGLSRFDYMDNTIVILTKDYNITKEFLYSIFGFDSVSIIVPATQDAADYYSKFITPEKEANVSLISNKGFLGIVSALIACLSFGSTVKRTNLIRNLGAIVGAIIMVVLSAMMSLPISPDKILLYQAIWALPVLLVSFVKS